MNNLKIGREIDKILKPDGSLAVSPGIHARRAAMITFENMGGIQKLTEWAEENPTDFYTKIFTKLMGQDMTVSGPNGGPVEFVSLPDSTLDEMISKFQRELGIVDAEFTEITEDSENV